MTKQLDQNEIAYLKAKQEKAELEFEAICWANNLLRGVRGCLDAQTPHITYEQMLYGHSEEEVSKFCNTINNKLNLPF